MAGCGRRTPLDTRVAEEDSGCTLMVALGGREGRLGRCVDLKVRGRGGAAGARTLEGRGPLGGILEVLGG